MLTSNNNNHYSNSSNSNSSNSFDNKEEDLKEEIAIDNSNVIFPTRLEDNNIIIQNKLNNKNINNNNLIKNNKNEIFKKFSMDLILHIFSYLLVTNQEIFSQNNLQNNLQNNNFEEDIYKNLFGYKYWDKNKNTYFLYKYFYLRKIKNFCKDLQFIFKNAKSLKIVNVCIFDNYCKSLENNLILEKFIFYGTKDCYNSSLSIALSKLGNTLQKVTLDKVFDCHFFEILKNCKLLQKFKLSIGCAIPNNKKFLIEELPNNSLQHISLQSLTLQNSFSNKNQLKTLFEMSNVKKLILQNQLITKEDFKEIKNLNVEQFILHGCQQFKSDGVEEFTKIVNIPNLKKLEMIDCGLTDKKLNFLFKKSEILENLKFLNLSKNPKLSSKGILPLKFNNFLNLNFLDFSYTNLGDEGITILSKSIGNTMLLLKLNACEIKNGVFSIFRYCKKLRRLDIKSNALTLQNLNDVKKENEPHQHYEIIYGPNNCKDLHIINFSTNQIINCDWISLNLPKYLTYLNLDYNPIGSENLNKIIENCNLYRLSVIGCNLNDDFILNGKLGREEMEMDAMKLNENDISDKALQLLLKVQKTMKRLYINENNLVTDSTLEFILRERRIDTFWCEKCPLLTSEMKNHFVNSCDSYVRI